MKPQRHTWIDYARGIAIILVLYRHVFEGIKNAGISITEYKLIEHANILFFSFRMPLFFIVSGIFVVGSLQKRGFSSFVQTKARTILYPYFLWAVLQISLQLILSDYVNANRTWRSYAELFYAPRTIDQFWYLYALFNVSILYVLSLHFLRSKTLYNVIIGLLFFMISVYTYQVKINLGFVGDILHYYLFFAIGDALGSVIRNDNYRKYFERWQALLLFFVPFIVSQYYFLYTNLQHPAMNYDYVEYYQPFLFIIIALIGALYIIMISFFLQKHSLIKWLHLLGQHSLYIYVAHVLVLASVRIFITKVLGIYNVPILLATGILLGLLVPVILYKLASRLNMKWIFTLESSRKEKKYINVPSAK
ncbi:MAG: acyltransferase [Sphingobacteriales bacterium]|nr:MAG: acyltransferase [Sphingobacteriales bacterium]